MLLLGLNRAEIEHDDEALRWFARARLILRDEKNDPLLEPDLQQQMRRDLEEYIEVTLKNGADPAGLEVADVGPDHLRQKSEHVYCLGCGTAKYPSAPIAQCDDSVHVALLRLGTGGVTVAVSDELRRLLNPAD